MVRNEPSRETTEWIYENFLKFYKPAEGEVVEWRPVTSFEIIIYLSDGTHMRYNGGDRSFGYLRNYETDELGNYTMSDEEYKQAFSDKFRRIMNASMVNQNCLSEQTGISRISISRYLNGKSLPDCRNLSRLANALGCSITELTNFD